MHEPRVLVTVQIIHDVMPVSSRHLLRRSSSTLDFGPLLLRILPKVVADVREFVKGVKRTTLRDMHGLVVLANSCDEPFGQTSAFDRLETVDLLGGELIFKPKRKLDAVLAGDVIHHHYHSQVAVPLHRRNKCEVGVEKPEYLISVVSRPQSGGLTSLPL